MLRHHRFELALFGLALAAIVTAVILAGQSWHAKPPPPSSAAVDRGLAALRSLDYPAARRSFTQAAKAGDAEGQIWLADMMENGLGEPVDGPGAAKWLTRAANDGSAEAARRLGELYRNGRVVLQDLDQAHKWLQRAADQGDLAAARDLGELYAEGLGVQKNLVTAYQWLTLAASEGDAVAARARDRVATQLAPDDLRRGQDLAEATLAAFSTPDAPPRNRTLTPITATVTADVAPTPAVTGV
jgi:localization factor PodJL